jgi:hypothetical protein
VAGGDRRNACIAVSAAHASRAVSVVGTANDDRQVSWWWLALAAVLAAMAWMLANVFDATHGGNTSAWHSLDLQPRLGMAQPWRWLTAAWVHWGTTHMTINIIGAGALAWLGWAARMSRAAALAWLIAWPLTQLLLLGLAGMGPDAWAALGLPPNVASALTTVPTHYGGLSGVLHAGISIVGIWLVLTNHDAKRWAGAALCVTVVGKVAWEATRPARTLGSLDDATPITSVTAAHAAGLLAGALCAIVVLAVLEAGRGPAAASHRALDSEF